MKHILAVVVVCALIAGVGWWILSDDPSSPHQRDATSATSAQSTDDKSDPNLHSGESEEVTTARQRVADATLALETAIAQRESAEADMQAAEQELEKLERWVEEIEARGDDPVDYADEGLARLQPALFAYEDAFERFELAESMEAEANEELAVAKTALSKAVASFSEEK